jgi:lipopolysaccharide export LptBFGC system permease protein LptF
VTIPQAATITLGFAILSALGLGVMYVQEIYFERTRWIHVPTAIGAWLALLVMFFAMVMLLGNLLGF